jgi:hypothetical protein
MPVSTTGVPNPPAAVARSDGDLGRGPIHRHDIELAVLVEVGGGLHVPVRGEGDRDGRGESRHP